MLLLRPSLRIAPKLFQNLATKAPQLLRFQSSKPSPIKQLRNLTKHENIYTIPNMLTFTRLVAAPVVGYLIVKQKVVLSLALFTYTCVTDFLDGYIARKYNMKSVVGSIIDPLADKSLMMICTGCLAAAGTIPVGIASIILGRDILLGLSALYYRYISLPAPKTFMRYWDFSIPSAEVHPTTISKYNTFFQMIYIAGAVLTPVVGVPYLDKFGYFVAGTTIASGLSYVFSKNAVKILR